MKVLFLLSVSILLYPPAATAQETTPSGSPSTQPAANATGDAAKPVALAALLEELRQQLADQRELIARNAAEIAAQRAMLVELQRQVGGTPVAPAAVTQQTGSSSTVHRQDPELPQKFVAAGDFPGSIEIPGTDAAFKIGAQARSTLVHSLAPLGADDRFITSSIPVGDERPAEEARTVYTAAPSRLNFDLRSPSPFGGVRTFVEYDFSGSGNAAHLRHAFIQSRRWIFGQTWSTFSDPEAKPTDIDFEGLNAISLFRQAQIRYTRPVRDGLSLSLAAENPAPDLTGAVGVNLTPDFVARLRWDPAHPVDELITNVAHVQGAVLIRTLRGALADQPQTTLTTGGAGVNVSGVLTPKWSRNASVKFATNNGWGIGRYIKDLEALGGQDAVYDPITGQLRALAVASGYIGYEWKWKPWLQSGLTYGVVRVSNLDIQPETALQRTQRTSISLTWLPMPHAELIGEFLFGQRVNKDGAHDTASQIQLGWKLTY